MRIVVIIPTYNERDNIGPLINALRMEFSAIPHDMEILVVDDNSPDGTAEVVREKAAAFPEVHLITGEKNGLGAAYIRGMTHALQTMQADAVFEMDADFSHDPTDVPRLVNALDSGADFVIGSRFVPGGSIPDDWGVTRRMISRWGNIFARYIGGLRNVRDCTAGFRAIRASVLSRISLDSIRVKGYAFQVALLHRAVSLGADIREIPVAFVDRSAGKTKLGIYDILESIVNAWWIRFESSRRFIKFAVVGVSGVIVNLSFFIMMINYNLSPFVASPAAFLLSTLSNFTLNAFWTFDTDENNTAFRLRFLWYTPIFPIALGFCAFLMQFLLFDAARPVTFQLIAVLPVMAFNYFADGYGGFPGRTR